MECSTCNINCDKLYKDNCKSCHTKQQKREFYLKNKEKINEAKKIWYKENKKSIKERDRKYHLENKEKRNEQSRIYYENNRVEIRKHRKEYNENNKEKIKEQVKKQTSKPEWRIANTIRTRTRRSLKSGKKYCEYLGCSMKFLREWFKFNFDLDELDMTFDNFSKLWEIDHVIPVATFKMENEQDRIVCFNWKNLSPLLKEKNHRKGKKLDTIQIIRNEIRIKLFLKHCNKIGLKENEEELNTASL